jgi:MSHA biogenesis protein MshL
MRRILLACATAMLASCAGTGQPPRLDPKMAEELDRLATPAPRKLDERAVMDALLPPLRIELPKVDGRQLEPRFDLSVERAPAPQVFTAIVSGTRYSMLVHPEVSGAISVNLKDVTVKESLDALRDLYGYEYRIEGTRIFIYPVTLQSRLFRVNYLVGQRIGRSDLRVISGSVSDSAIVPGAPGAAGVAGVPGGLPGGGQQSIAARATDSSRIQTSTRSDFWTDLQDTLRILVGPGEGRSVVINAQAGAVVVRAMPAELRQIEEYLRVIRVSVEKQVMLEAKIVEVTLNERFQAGINWSAFPTSGLNFGLLGANTNLGTTGTLSTGAGALATNPATRSVATGAIGSTLATAAGAVLPGVPGGALFSLALQTSNFASLIQFLESQGSVQVLSSPRIATLNNQKAVLKVGTDEFFLTNITGGTTGVTGGTTTTAGTNTFPTLTLQPFFSGVALDITPQIDEASSIILHVHPSVSTVRQDDRVIDLGTLFGGSIRLPLAKSTVSETDSIVKVSDGNIVAIGGLMKLDVIDSKSGLPGAQDIPGLGALFRNNERTGVKKELVILIRPTLVGADHDYTDEIRATRDRMYELGGERPAPAPVIDKTESNSGTAR